MFNFLFAQEEKRLKKMSSDPTEEFDREALENGDLPDDTDEHLPYNRFSHILPMI